MKIEVANIDSRHTDAAKEAGFDPASCKFLYEVAERIESHSFADVLKRAQDMTAPAVETVDEVVARRAKNSFVTLLVKCGRKSRSVPLSYVPMDVLQHYKRQAQADEDERKRIDSLTPDEREAEVQSCLRELRKGGGFMELRIGG